MLKDRWNKLPENWKSLVYKEWLLFIKQRFSLTTFLRDDSYGLDFILCKSLGIESSNPEYDLKHLEEMICDSIENPSVLILDEIFSMQYLSISSDITFLSPLIYFPQVRVLDFSGQNESRITDFSILGNRSRVYVLDCSDYQTIDFDVYSNIKLFDNITYINAHGMPKEIEDIYPLLTLYNIL